MSLLEKIKANIGKSKEEVQKNRDADKWTTEFLNSLEWKRFEEVCVEYLKIKNCEANVSCIGSDGGIDITIRDKTNRVIAIAQCKSWKKPIGVNLVRELYGVMASEKVRHGIFLTTSTYSEDAMKFANDKNLMLIDSKEFINLVNNMKPSERILINNIAKEGDYQTPTCVKCNVKMVKRVAKKGKKAGHEFWGCSNFPKCKITMYVSN